MVGKTNVYIDGRGNESDYSKMLVTDCFFVDDASLTQKHLDILKEKKEALNTEIISMIVNILKDYGLQKNHQ